MFTPAERQHLRDVLVTAAHDDPRVTGAALTGSAAVDREDRWSDIDLALCVDDEADLAAVVADWTDLMYRDHAAVHHLDMWLGATRFRVFLLSDTLQVDVAFWPATEFGATAATFRLLFGTAVERPHAEPPSPEELVGTAWLYALHARSSLARGRLWQAEYMVSAMRDHVLALACVRYGLPAVQGRGMDELPPAVTAPLAAAMVTSLDPGELHRAFRATADALLDEAADVDAELTARLTGPLRELAGVPQRWPAS